MQKDECHILATGVRMGKKEPEFRGWEGLGGRGTKLELKKRRRENREEKNHQGDGNDF